MERIVEQAFLYDFYGELLTGHQRQIYEDFVLNDLSLSEIAQEQGISRQGVHDLVKRCNKILEEYESKLHLVEKFLTTKQQIGKIYELSEQLNSDKDLAECSKEIASQIEEIAKNILDNL